MYVIRALLRRCKELVRPRSTAAPEQTHSIPLRFLTSCAAYALVASSAGLCGLYAFAVGIEHGAAMAVLLVFMAISLECLKPVAVAATFDAFRAWAIVRGALLAVLALSAVAFSLTSELSLMATSRGDIVAKRASVVEQHEERKARLQSARGELAQLMPAREEAEIRADILRLRSEFPRAGGCTVLDGPVSRLACPKIAALEGEIARGKRRAALNDEISNLSVLASSDSPPSSGDPGATALAAYLAALGFVVPVVWLSQWMSLVPVVALELGAALSFLVVRGVSGSNASAACPQQTDRGAVGADLASDGTGGADTQATDPTPLVVPAKCPGRTRGRTRSQTQKPRYNATSSGHAKSSADAAVIGLLRARGGQVTAGQRELARAIGVSKTRANEILHGLHAAGHIALRSTRTGTTVTLASNELRRAH